MKSVIKTVRANQIVGITSYTGELCFCEEGFYFKAKGVNSNIVKQMVDYNDISTIKKRNTLGFIPNGIIIQLNDGTVYTYAVTKRRDVFSFLLSRIRESE